MNVGRAIVTLRAEHGISQEGLAFDAGLSRHYMYKLENNLASPTVNTLVKLAGVFKIRPSELLARAESMR